LAGLPPGLIGLFGKVVVFQAAVDGGAGWLAVVMAVNVVIGLAYYLYWTALLFAPAGEGDSTAVGRDASRPPSVTPWPAAIAVGVTVALGVVLSVAPGIVLDVLRVLPSPL
jgi:NADH-quinone oxidoreductase subunit N